MNILLITTLDLQINLKESPSHICMDFLAFSSLQINFLNFSQICIFYHGWGKFSNYDFRITGKCICKSKNRIYSFLLMPLRKILPNVLMIIPQAEKNYLFFPGSAFWKFIFPVERGWEKKPRELKNDQN